MTDQSDSTERDGANCFVCGPENASGLQVKFQLIADVCRGEFTPASEHCGFDGVTHGGIIFSLLDDVMANCLFLQGIRCVTAKCEIRFRSPLPTGSAVQLEARIRKQKRSLAVIEGKAIRAETGELVAECEASFMIVAASEG